MGLPFSMDCFGCHVDIQARGWGQGDQRKVVQEVRSS